MNYYFNTPFIIGCIYIIFWIVYTIIDIGKPLRPSIATKWYHVIGVACTLAIPFICGLYARIIQDLSNKKEI
jgi:hypothetical protein